MAAATSVGPPGEMGQHLGRDQGGCPLRRQRIPLAAGPAELGEHPWPGRIGPSASDVTAPQTAGPAGHDEGTDDGAVDARSDQQVRVISAGQLSGDRSVRFEVVGHHDRQLDGVDRRVGPVVGPLHPVASRAPAGPARAARIYGDQPADSRAQQLLRDELAGRAQPDQSDAVAPPVPARELGTAALLPPSGASSEDVEVVGDAVLLCSDGELTESVATVHQLQQRGQSPRRDRRARRRLPRRRRAGCLGRHVVAGSGAGQAGRGRRAGGGERVSARGQSGAAVASVERYPQETVSGSPGAGPRCSDVNRGRPSCGRPR